MKKYITLLAVAFLFSSLSAMAQFYVKKTNGDIVEIDGNVEFSNDATTGDYAIGDTYSAENSISEVSEIYRMPSVFRVYSMQYDLGKDGVYVHPYDHYRVDYDDPNCINEYGNVADPDDPFWPDARIVESEPRDMVMIVVDFDLGYDSPFNHDYDPSGFISVKGLNSDLEFSGNEYNVVWTYREDIDLYAWGLTMPKEAVLIEAKTSMLTTYEGEEFVDTYDGFYIHWGAEYAGTVASTATADVDFELKSNTLFDIKSKTDRVPGYTYDNRGVYVFDNGKISYDLESCRAVDGRDRDGIAIQGDYNPGAWVMTALDPVQGGLDDTYRYFFTIKKSAGIAKYVAASNENGNKFLIELTTKDDNKEYWYYDAPIGQRSLSKVIVDNAEKGIDEEGADMLVSSVEGGVLFRYSYADGKPVFAFPGAEAGTYTDSEGDGGELVLDGLGNGTYDGVAGTYVIDETGMNVTFTYGDSSDEVTFVIYKNEGTYSKQGTTGEVSLTGTYSTDDSYSYVMRVTINEDASKADFYFENNGTVYHDEHGVNCVYDAGSKKLTLSGFVMGNPDNWANTSLRTVDFTVSDDGTYMTCTTDRIKQPNQSPSTNVNVSGTVLNKE